MRFLFIILLISLLFNQDRLSTILYNYENDLNNTKTHNNNSIKALLQSSVIPGSGQFFTNNQKTKGLIFFGIEILSLAGMSYYNKKADSFKSDYQDYGDQNWNFSTWCSNYYNWDNIDNPYFNVFANDESLVYPKIWEDSHYIKFSYEQDDITRIISSSSESFEQLYTDFNLNDFNSVETFIEDYNVQIIKDHNFYENISKYNHFFSGWNDNYDITIYDNNGYIVATSPNKGLYRSIYDESVKNYNLKNNFVNFIFINHFVSMLDALIVTKINSNASIKSSINEDLNFYELKLNIKLN